MKKGDLDKIPKKGDGSLHFQDVVHDNLKLDDANLPLCQFERVGLKGAAIKRSKLTQCRFTDTYFRLAKFDDVDFTGTTFRNCNLDRATFRGCNFRYCQFENTLVNPGEIAANLPTEPNLRRDLARNLRQNFESLGDRRSADMFLTYEISAEEEELWARVRSRTEHYKNKYNGWDRFFAFCQYIGLKFSGVTWGYGYRIRRLFVSYLILVAALGLVVYLFKFQFVDTQHNLQSLAFWEAIYQSFAETLGSMTTPFVPESIGARTIQIVQRFTGTLFLALLAAAAYRRISR